MGERLVPGNLKWAKSNRPGIGEFTAKTICPESGVVTTWGKTLGLSRVSFLDEHPNGTRRRHMSGGYTFHKLKFG